MSTATEGRLSESQLTEIVRRLVDEFSPRAVYLFGSQAYGEPRPDSDIDVLVIVDRAEEARVGLARRGYARLHGLGLPVELHFSSPGRFRDFSSVIGSFHREVSQRGRLVYAA